MNLSLEQPKRAPRFGVLAGLDVVGAGVAAQLNAVGMSRHDANRPVVIIDPVSLPVACVMGDQAALKRFLYDGVCRLEQVGVDAVIVPDALAAELLAELRPEVTVTVLQLAEALRFVAEGSAPEPAKRPFKIGVIGGVGPAATVDLLDKIVVNTDARCDQDHVKVIVEQNPQIPDRTAHLLEGGADPTIALYATAKRLEAAGASVIAIPCNTAHVFVPRIQPGLSIPIVNMLEATLGHIRETYPGRQVGLLATNGTIRTRAYHAVAEALGITLMVPDADDQTRVMAAIYGQYGVKAGYVAGVCADDLNVAMTALVKRGAEVLILGCTELPLLVQECPDALIAGQRVAVVDPTAILARTCIRLAREHVAV
ncbi:aspartate/glutamate racemase family protein [Propionivibrio dicarboxylicus]|uniref:Aspartate racemase n=1 Tax=Propionivibrio dicarboxylicus TaxID=83767 RepID=A0A1G8GA56_9RHOO|nr:amino acid racemase [Propionivibrio dicarboxylicus]SDH91259.1 aspartate racemase [Propionivibrio dicarboxylicus]